MRQLTDEGIHEQSWDKVMVKFFSTSALVLVAMAFMMACSDVPTTPTKDNGSPNNGEITGKPSGSSANPAFVSTYTTSVKGKVLSTLFVNDVDGSDRTSIYSSSTAFQRIFFSTWSPTGGSVSFVEMPSPTSNGWSTGTVWGDYRIKAVDVAVSSGKVVASNARTIYSVNEADQVKIVSQAWCPSTTGPGAGKIAFMVLTPTQAQIRLVPATGGTATTIYSVDLTDAYLRGSSLSWNSAGDRLAFSQSTGSSTPIENITFSIKVIDVNGNVMLSLLDGAKNIAECRWAKNGVNTIAYMSAPAYGTTNDVTYSLDAVSAVAGATPTTILPTCRYSPLWSPDGTEIISKTGGDVWVRINATTLSTTSIPQGFYYGDWK